MATEVGVRQLRQNLSVYLRRVARGERFIVTDRRRPVAQLGPLDETRDSYERWLVANRLRPPAGTHTDLPAALDAGAGNPLSRMLERDREEGRG